MLAVTAFKCESHLYAMATLAPVYCEGFLSVCQGWAHCYYSCVFNTECASTMNSCHIVSGGIREV